MKSFSNVASRMLCVVIFAALSCGASLAQSEADQTKMVVHMKDGQETTFMVSDIDHVRFETVENNAPSTLPIEYMADHYINKEGTGFSTSYDNDAQGLFNWYVANGVEDIQYNKNGKNLFAQDFLNDYHMPSLEEMRGVFPDRNDGYNITFTGNEESLNCQEEIEYGGVKKTFTADYRSFENEATGYGLRFKPAKNGSDEFPNETTYSLLQAFRYKVVGDLVVGNNGSRLEIRVRYLGSANKDMTLDDISSDEFWNKNSEKDIVRYIPMSGVYVVTDENGDPVGNVYGKGTDANLWTSTPDPKKSEWAFKAYAGIAGAYVIGELDKMNAYSIAPFRNVKQ